MLHGDTLNLDKYYLDGRRLVSQSNIIKSNYFFLKEHNGFKQGKTHLLIGATHAGKTSLTRGILKDLVETGMKNSTIGLWLSEETKEDYEDELSKTTINLNGNKIIVKSEQTVDDPRKMNVFLNEMIEQKPDILLFDNITTSHFYMDRKIDIQSSFAKKLKKIGLDNNIPIVIVAHTGAEINDAFMRLINPNDIRGCKSIVNMAEFVYILQMFKVGSSRFQTLRIEKHRGEPVENYFYELGFNKKEAIYDKDRQIDFDRIKELFKARNKLNG